MQRTLSTLALLTLLPTTALALTIAPGNLYKDARTNDPETAGINMLSREGIVKGYDNGFFGVTHHINRAEFLKIAMMSAADSTALSFAPTDCFPDVQSADWFSPFVCAAKDQGVVSGRTQKDGSVIFDPAADVTYGEALKMLDILFAYPVVSVSASHWAESYYRAAAEKNVDLPVTIDLDTPLTRGLAARLTAAFLAQSQGKLDELRLAESGNFSSASSSVSSVSSPSSSSSSVSSSTSSSSASSVSSSSASTSLTLPSVSHFLIAGPASDAIGDVTVKSIGETARINWAQAKVFNDVTSVDTLQLVDTRDGSVIMELKKRTTNDTSDYKQIYEKQVALADQVQIPADVGVRLALRAVVKNPDYNGASEQLLQLRTFSVTIHGETTQTTTNIPAQAPFPKHQTSFGRITQILRLSPSALALSSGTGNVITAFSVSGSMITGKTLSVEQLVFAVVRSGALNVKNWRIKQVGSTTSVPCTVDQYGTEVTCANMQLIGVIDKMTPLQLELVADVSGVAAGASLRADLAVHGSPENLGSVQWTDQAGHFRWIEGASDPVLKGTILTK